MTIQEYNDHTGISASAIKAGRASMMQMHHAMTTPRDTDAPTPAMRWGSLAHAALLEPARFAASIAVWEGGRKAGKEWTAFVFAAANTAKEIVTPDELERLNAMQAAARANGDARLFMSRVAAVETPLVWESVHGVGSCKGRPDCVGDRFIGDYKTARDIEPRRLFSQFASLGYAHQLAWYRDGFMTISGKSVTSCWILAQQSVPPYECGVIEIPQTVLDAALGAGVSEGGEDTCIAIARRYRACEACGSYPGRYQGVEQYEPPAWAGVGGDDVPDMKGVEE
jgi:hypothetical protein